MSTQFDIYEYRAALLEWRQENVGQARLIFVAHDSHALLQAIRDDALRYANSLTHHYAQAIDAVDVIDRRVRVEVDEELLHVMEVRAAYRRHAHT